MAETYRVAEIVERDEWGNEHGDFMGYKLRLEGPSGPVNQIIALNQKRPERSPITEGQELFGEIDASGTRPKFKKINPEYAGGGGGGGQAARTAGSRPAGTKDDDYPTPEFWAAKDRAIQRQHSQEMALRLIVATGDASQMDLGNDTVTPAYLNNIVRRLADWFDRDVSRVAEWPSDSVRGREEQSNESNGAQGTQQSEPQPVTAGSDPTTDDDVPF